jgi:Skp family chaperone for outer membrane proteins
MKLSNYQLSVITQSIFESVKSHNLKRRLNEIPSEKLETLKELQKDYDAIKEKYEKLKQEFETKVKELEHDASKISNSADSIISEFKPYNFSYGKSAWHRNYQANLENCINLKYPLDPKLYNKIQKEIIFSDNNIKNLEENILKKFIK